MVDKKEVDLPEALADLQRFVDINMPKLDDVPKIAVMQMAVGMKEQAEDDEDDDYVKGVMVGLWLSHLVMVYCERKVN